MFVLYVVYIHLVICCSAHEAKVLKTVRFLGVENPAEVENLILDQTVCGMLSGQQLRTVSGVCTIDFLE